MNINSLTQYTINKAKLLYPEARRSQKQETEKELHACVIIRSHRVI